MARPGQFGFEIDPDGDVTLRQGSLTVEENVSITGTLSVGGAAVTATAAELNIMDGVTATKDEINTLDGVTATKDELNLLASCGLSAGDVSRLVSAADAKFSIAYGVRSTAAAQEDLPTGMTTVVAAFATMVGAPSLTHMWTRATVGNQSGAPAAGSIRVNNTKPTASGNVTQIDATSPFGSVAWLAIGTR